MEKDSTGAAAETEPASPLRKNINEDTCAADSHTSRAGTCGATDVARARWTLLRQVLRQKQVDSPEVKQVSVRRFATFDLFSRMRLVTQDPSDTSDDQWVEYRSVYFPEYSALLRHVMGYNEGHGSLFTSQVAPQESGLEMKAMARGYFTAHWDQTIYVMTELSALHIPLSSQLESCSARWVTEFLTWLVD
ncbi:calmodulin-lysine N-methyltransferase-like protein [Lates japonicus]|uniref:Calmodulin-lysine N-methyltransferase-like protein n=1 Tax=Lates japonicus TaxID=270547 RepID=A0AAD3N1V8_LATJO|nr:calmodulin-lysine N-methyltransferase-like protein [Lates japonicus]